MCAQSRTENAAAAEARGATSGRGETHGSEQWMTDSESAKVTIVVSMISASEVESGGRDGDDCQDGGAGRDDFNRTMLMKDAGFA